MEEARNSPELHKPLFKGKEKCMILFSQVSGLHARRWMAGGEGLGEKRGSGGSGGNPHGGSSR